MRFTTKTHEPQENVAQQISNYFVGQWKPHKIEDWFFDDSFTPVASYLYKETCRFRLILTNDGPNYLKLGKILEGPLQLSTVRRDKTQLYGELVVADSFMKNRGARINVLITYIEKGRIKVNYTWVDHKKRVGEMFWYRA